MGSFRNRIINGDMRIAQRGTSASTGGYLIDRWGIELISGTVTQSQLILSFSDTPYQVGFKYAANVAVTSSSTGAPFYQRIENINITDLNWGTSQGSPVTVSLWYKTNATPGSIIPISIRTILWIGGSAFQVYPYNSVAIGQNTWQFVSFTVPPIPNVGYTLGMANNGGQDQLQLYIGSASGYSTTAVAGTWTGTSAMGSTAQTNIYNTPGTYLTITGVQLEKGTVATPFEFRNYAQELALCQRYYQELPFGGSHFTGTGRCMISLSATNGNMTATGMYFQVPMRANPAPTYYGAGTAPGNFTVYAGSSGTQQSFIQSSSNVTTAQISSTMMATNIITTAVTASGGSSAWYDMGWIGTCLGITLNAEL